MEANPRSSQELLAVFAEAKSRRATESTAINATSSRSHCITSIYLVRDVCDPLPWPAPALTLHAFGGWRSPGSPPPLPLQCHESSNLSGLDPPPQRRGHSGVVPSGPPRLRGL